MLVYAVVDDSLSPASPLGDSIDVFVRREDAERESPKFERAAMRWLERYMDERSPTLRNFAKVVRGLERRGLDK